MMEYWRQRRGQTAILGLGLGLAATGVACDGDGGLPGGDICGPCGSIATGQLSISGDARLDGFFAAVADLQGASATVRGNFEGELRALGEIYGMAEGTVDADFVASLIAEIRADITANVDGSVTLEYRPPQCSANVSIAVEAQASCEANAECEVEANPGMVSVECSGTCTGSCSGGCSGEISCSPPSGSVGCDVGCEGTCELSAAAACEGTCRGTCDGECSLTNAAGECEGECSGMCEGSCELSAMAECGGTCHGTCHASVTPPECEGLSIQCNAECSGMCEGGCAGEFEPPSASASCEASAECNAQASAQGEANLECTPPSLDFSFQFAAGVDASAQAAFLGRLDLLRVRLAAALQAATRAQALVTGEVNGEVVFDTSPVARVAGELQGFASADAIADFDIAVGRLPCVVPAFQEAISAMADVQGDLQFTATASVDLFAFVSNPQG